MPKSALPRGILRTGASLFCLQAFLVGSSASRAQEVSDIPDTDAVVFISVRAKSSNEDRSQGSGMLLGPQGFILTASHIFTDYDPQAEKILVRMKSVNSNPVPAEIVRCGTGTVDICIVTVS